MEEEGVLIDEEKNPEGKACSIPLTQANDIRYFDTYHGAGMLPQEPKPKCGKRFPRVE